MGRDHAAHSGSRGDLARARTVHVHVRLGLIAREADLTEEHVNPAGAFDDRVAQVGVARVEQGHEALGILLGGSFDAQAVRLNRVQGAVGADRHGTDPVGLAQLHVGEGEFDLVCLIVRGVFDLAHAAQRLGGTVQGQRGCGRSRAPLAINLEGDDVAHVVGVAVRQREGVELARAHMSPQRAERPRPHVAHEREGPFFPRSRVDAASLNQVGRCRRLRARHRTGSADNSQLHAIPPPVFTRATEPTSGPRKRRARRGNASEAPVARN